MPREVLAEHLTTLAWTGLSTAWPPPRVATAGCFAEDLS